MKRRGGHRAVGVVGLGHVGLCTAVCFASRGIATVGVDADEERAHSVAKGIPPFMEKGLPRLLPEVIGKRKFRATSDYSALAETDYQFIAVPTPSSADGSIDLSYVRSASASVARILREGRNYKLIVIKSTVTPGTALREVLPILRTGSRMELGDFGLASNPEFLREGKAIEDTLHPDRVVIGTEDNESLHRLLSLYKRFYSRMPKKLLTTTVNAELTKYASNSFLATKISFINEIANLCSKFPGADVLAVARGMGLDRRIGPEFLRAGLGYGGSCFPKDVRALIKVAEREGVNLGVARAANRGNERQVLVAVNLAERLLGDLRGKRIALLGLTFKPESDDVRDAVSQRLIAELIKKDAKVTAYDPSFKGSTKRLPRYRIDYAESARSCLKGADCCILVTEWSEFLMLNTRQFKRLMRTPVVVDGRRAFDPELFLENGVKFAAVGLGSRSNQASGSREPPHAS